MITYINYWVPLVDEKTDKVYGAIGLQLKQDDYQHLIPSAVLEVPYQVTFISVLDREFTEIWTQKDDGMDEEEQLYTLSIGIDGLKDALAVKQTKALEARRRRMQGEDEDADDEPESKKTSEEVLASAFTAETMSISDDAMVVDPETDHEHKEVNFYVKSDSSEEDFYASSAKKESGEAPAADLNIWYTTSPLDGVVTHDLFREENALYVIVGHP